MKIAFLNLDGTLIAKPPQEFHIREQRPVEILDGVVEQLRGLLARGYKLVIMTNQEGLGTRDYPLEEFKGRMMDIVKLFQKHEIEFYDVYICQHSPEANCRCRQPRSSTFKDLLRQAAANQAACVMASCLRSDAELAWWFGISFYKTVDNGRFPAITI